MHSKKNIIFIHIICFCGLFLFSCSTKKEKNQEKGVASDLPDEVTRIKAIKLIPTDFEQEIIANGTVNAAQKADLNFPVSEIVTQIYVKNGEKVQKGQKIASLDQFKLKNSLEQAEDNLYRSRLELQDILIGQGYSLNDSASIPDETMKIAKVKSSYDQNLSAYNLARYNYEHATLYAPFNGIVANLFSKLHNIPSTSEPFCTIIDNDHPEIIFMVLESELPSIDLGDKIVVSPYSLNNYTIQGKITEINPIVNKNGMVRVKALTDKPTTKLYDGMNVKVQVQRSIPDQLVIPKEALVLRTNKQVVFTLKDGKALWNYVQTGPENSLGYIVTKGLQAGDSIIYEGNINLAHESPVLLIK